MRSSDTVQLLLSPDAALLLQPEALLCVIVCLLDGVLLFATDPATAQDVVLFATDPATAEDERGRLLLLTSYFLTLTSHFLHLTSYFLLLTSEI